MLGGDFPYLFQPIYLLTYLLMELSPSGGAVNSAATQEFPNILWNPKVHWFLVFFSILRVEWDRIASVV
jgi:hypothetical protein